MNLLYKIRVLNKYRYSINRANSQEQKEYNLAYILELIIYDINVLIYQKSFRFHNFESQNIQLVCIYQIIQLSHQKVCIPKFIIPNFLQKIIIYIFIINQMLCPYYKNEGKLKKMVVKKKPFDHQIDDIIDCQVVTFNDVQFHLNSELCQKLSTFSLKCLSLTKCQLIDLEYFPKIPTLEALYLDDNLLEVECIGWLKYYYDKLDVLSLTSNNINFCLMANCVGSLEKFSKLNSLNVLKNFFHQHKQELFDESFYISQRKNFFKYIPTLQLLDCLPQKGNKETSDILQYFKNEEEQRFYLKQFLKYDLLEGQFEFPDIQVEDQGRDVAQIAQQQFNRQQEEQISKNDGKVQQVEKNQSSSQQTNSQSQSSNPYGEFNSPQFSKQVSKKKKKIKKTKIIDKTKKEQYNSLKSKNKDKKHKKDNKDKNYKQKNKQDSGLRRSDRFK
ncbi:hypothetical protein pb186bvf_001605 [Paramecium bursaria]